MDPFLSPNWSSYSRTGVNVTTDRCQYLIDVAYDDIAKEASTFGKAFAMIWLVLITIMGNFLVIIAVLTTTRLQTATNYFIASLAVSDFLIGIGVLPFSFTQDLLGVWIFGYPWCRIWLALDVWVSTASIYNLVIIALDRYIGVTRPLTYRSLVTSKRAALAIAGTWIWSFLVSFPPMITFQSNDKSEPHGSDVSGSNINDCQCTALDNSAAYIIFSASSSFYVPFIALTYIYARIYLKIRRATVAADKGYMRVKRRHDDAVSNENNNTTKENDKHHSAQKVLVPAQSPNLEAVALRVHRGGYNAAGAKKDTNCAVSKAMPLRRTATLKDEIQSLYRKKEEEAAGGNTSTTGNSKQKKLQNYNSIDCVSGTDDTTTRVECSSLMEKSVVHKQQERYDKKLKREVRAAKTVAIVTCCFFFCWSGFCVVYTMKASTYCQGEDGNDGRSTCIPSWMFALVLWLGYTNSALNPLIYAVCNRQFRWTFQRLLCCSCYKRCTMNGEYGKFERKNRPPGQQPCVGPVLRPCDSDLDGKGQGHSSSCGDTEMNNCG